MAAPALPSTMDQTDYTIAEQELQDHILEVYGNRDNEDDMFRPTLADVQKIGFFSLDRSAQTDDTEIVDLKEMTEVLQILLQDVANLRRDINFTKHVMQADHESKLQSKSLELYCRINERVSELEKIHLDRVSSLRKAFRQQLADAVSRLSVMYKKNMESNMIRERTRQQSDLKGQDARMQEMKATIARNESIIQMLQLQLQQQKEQQQTEHHERQFFMDDTSSTKSKSTPATESPVMATSESPQRANSRIQALEEEMEEMRVQQEKLEKKHHRLEEAIEIKEDEVTQLNKQIEELQRRLEKEQILNDQLLHEKEEIKMEAEKELSSSKKQLMQQKLEMEQMNNEQLRLAKEEALSVAKEEAARLQAQEQARMKELVDQKKDLEKQLAVERSKASEKSAKGDAENESLKLSDTRLKNEIKKLKEEIDRIHHTWEKKFSILQASMHALKDESYLRQTLQRQAATLHHASVSYAADTPAGITPKQGSPQKKPLPEIRRNSRSMSRNPQDKDYISYTVSAQSGRGTGVMSVDENQVVSDTEQDLPSEFIPIPEPPARNPQDCAAEDSRPSTRSHVVVLPTTAV